VRSQIYNCPIDSPEEKQPATFSLRSHCSGARAHSWPHIQTAQRLHLLH